MALEEMQMFENELQAKQAKECYALAVERIKTVHPDTSVEKYAEKVWFSVAGVVVHEGYEAAKEYALNADISFVNAGASPETDGRLEERLAERGR